MDSSRPDPEQVDHRMRWRGGPADATRRVVAVGTIVVLQALSGCGKTDADQRTQTLADGDALARARDAEMRIAGFCRETLRELQTDIRRLESAQPGTFLTHLLSWPVTRAAYQLCVGERPEDPAYDAYYDIGRYIRDFVTPGSKELPEHDRLAALEAARDVAARFGTK